MTALPLPRVLRRVWMRFFVDISRTLYADDVERLDKAYLLEDPWNIDSEREAYRFEAINAMIRERIGRVGRALEIGSGEGRHTERLLEVCAEVDGIEASPQALARARARCPGARFFEARFPELPAGLAESYDLVVASETLYYIRDVAAAVAAMNRLGRFALVTFYRDQAASLSPYFDGLPGVLKRELSRDGASWSLYLWETATAR